MVKRMRERVRSQWVRRRTARDDSGMSTAEYAVGTLAACGFAGVLWVVVHSGAVHSLLQSVVTRALNLAP